MKDARRIDPKVVKLGQKAVLQIAFAPGPEFLARKALDLVKDRLLVITETVAGPEFDANRALAQEVAALAKGTEAVAADIEKAAAAEGWETPGLRAAVREIETDSIHLATALAFLRTRPEDLLRSRLLVDVQAHGQLTRMVFAMRNAPGDLVHAAGR